MNSAIKTFMSLVVVLSFASSTAAARQWKDGTGNFSIEAEFVDLVEGNVRLKKTDGEIITLPLKKLGRQEISFIRKHVATLEKVKRTIEEHGSDPAWLFSALLDGGYSADIGKLPPIDNPIARQIVSKVMNELRNGKLKPNAKAIPKLLAVVKANNLSGSLTIFPETTVQFEQLRDHVQEVRTPAKDFFDEKNGQIVQAESANSVPLKWYRSDWLELGVANDEIRVVRISSKN